MDFHVLHPDQNDVYQRANRDHPPKDRRQSGGHIGKPLIAELVGLNRLPQSILKDDLFSFVAGLEVQQTSDEQAGAHGFALRHNALALLRPAFLDRVAGIFTQALL